MILTHSPAVFEALGTTATVATTDPVAVAQAVEAVTREIAAVDASCSRFRPDSELNAVNRAAGKAVAVSGVLIEAVELALRAAELTAGRVVPTVGMAMRVIGYDRDFALVPRTGPAMRITVGPVPPWQMVKVDPVSSTIQLPAGVELDLGATAKAWCADRGAQAASAATGCGVLVSLGGDLATAGTAPDGGWAVRVAEDHAAPFDTAGQTVALRSGGLATSSTTVRRWQRGADHVHHLVDPNTGSPVRSGWRTASVAAGCCADANIASTAAVILGEEASAWLDARRLPARLVAADGTVTLVGDWPVSDEAGPWS